MFLMFLMSLKQRRQYTNKKGKTVKMAKVPVVDRLQQLTKRIALNTTSQEIGEMSECQVCGVDVIHPYFVLLYLSYIISFLFGLPYYTTLPRVGS